MLLTNLSNIKLTNKQKARVVLTCDFKTSPNCQAKWETSYYGYMKGRQKRNNKDCCNKCACRISNSGINNPSFKYEKREDFFTNINTEEQTYLLGWIAADGSIRNRTLHIELNRKDVKILKYFKNLISKNSPIVNRKRNNNCYITISSTKIIEDICISLNVLPGSKQNKIKLPSLNVNLIRHFVRGFFEGDGWISVYNNYLKCGIATICPALQRDFVDLSKKLKINCYQGKKSIEWYGYNAEKFLQFIYEDSQYYLDRKFNKYKNWSKHE